MITKTSKQKIEPGYSLKPRSRSAKMTLVTADASPSPGEASTSLSPSPNTPIRKFQVELSAR